MPSSDEQSPPELKIDRGENGGLITFRNREEFLAYLRAEAAHFNWLSSNEVSGAYSHASDLAGHQNRYFNNWVNAFSDANLNPKAVASQLTRLAEELSKFGAISKDSPEAIFIAGLKQSRGTSVALGAFMAMFPGLRIQAGFTSAVAHGMFLASLFKENLTNDSVEAQKQLFESAAAEIRSELAAVKSARDNAEQLQDELQRKTERRFEAIAKLQKQISSRWNDANSKLVKEAIDRINLTDNTFKEHMRLKAAVEYWTTKATTHSDMTGLWGWISAGYALLVVAGLVVWFVCGVPAIAPMIEFASGKPTALTFLYAGTALTVLTILFWVGRVLVRLYLSEHHLAIDARFRSTMTETYLALINESAATEAERNIVLTAIFRPTTDGIVKDDAAPFFSGQSFFSKQT